MARERVNARFLPGVRARPARPADGGAAGPRRGGQRAPCHPGADDARGGAGAGAGPCRRDAARPLRQGHRARHQPLPQQVVREDAAGRAGRRAFGAELRRRRRPRPADGGDARLRRRRPRRAPRGSALRADLPGLSPHRRRRRRDRRSGKERARHRLRRRRRARPRRERQGGSPRPRLRRAPALRRRPRRRARDPDGAVRPRRPRAHRRVGAIAQLRLRRAPRPGRARRRGRRGRPRRGRLNGSRSSWRWRAKKASRCRSPPRSMLSSPGA